VDWRSSFDAKGASESDAQKAISGIWNTGLDEISKAGK
jgi:hypothetical protein